MVKIYIGFNRKERKNAVSSLEKDLFKLMINCVYGKRTEDLIKRIGVRLLNNEKDYVKHVSKPTFISQKIFDEHFAAINEIKLVLTLKKPIYVGFSVLQLSKWLMHDFHYNFIRKYFDANLLFTVQTVLLMKLNQKSCL